MTFIDRDELKSWLGIADDSTVSNDELDTACVAACSYINNVCGWEFEQTPAVARTFTPSDCKTVDVDAFTDLDGLVVKVDRDDDGVYEETVTVHAKAYGSFPFTQLVAVDTTFPISRYGRRTVEVTAKWGWADVPAPVRHAALMTAARLYKRRESPNGTFLFDEATQAMRLQWRDPDVEKMLMGYRSARRYVV